ncbi:hypothetical protein Ahy_B09g099480 [Arachis hypogaea]|uniref:Endonuclease/exonuclease/phosphatase domain-containing protein n=1 Tax=Arachis hypogaea TaxID=3818 RepID=A0A444XUS2_ARAHY|nr:hypothetical protein Ahy_B09g099480 [Arachis hypogaea]
MNIVSWNCRSAGDRTFPSLICDIRREYDANFLILLETHISGTKDSSFVVEATGHSGGKWCLWDSTTWKVDVLEHNRQFVHLRVTGNNYDSWMLSAVYGRPQRLTRRILCNSIHSLFDSVNLLWCISGDFNAILHDYERSGGSNRIERGACSNFQSCVITSLLTSVLWVGLIRGREIILLKDWTEVPNVGCLSQLVNQPSSQTLKEEDVTLQLQSFAQDVPCMMKPFFMYFEIVSMRLIHNLATKGEWAYIFGVMVSSIWYFRNRFNFEGDITVVRAKVEQKQVIKWSSPVEGRIKLNVNGSFFSQANSATYVDIRILAEHIQNIQWFLSYVKLFEWHIFTKKGHDILFGHNILLLRRFC